MKKLINRPESVIAEMLEGIVVLDPDLAKLSGHNVLIRSNAAAARDRQVALISGGGSGHEPAHAGYIGNGMLSAAVAGDIFTSPSVDSVFAAIQAVAGKPGALLIVKNYTGDRLNFGLAAEMAKAEGIPVKIVVVADDVALRDTLHAEEARGLAGTVLVHKIAGAAAAEGKSLEDVRAAAQAAADAMGTMGVSLSAGTSPATGKPSFLLCDDEMELGLGIHGEPGVRRMPLLPADPLTDALIENILAARPFRSSDRLVVLINNLGATTAMELAILARRAFANLESRGFQIERMYSGTFLSSLDMAGISLSILPVDDERLSWLDAATTAVAWPNLPRRPPGAPEHRTKPSLGRLPMSSKPVSHAERTATDTQVGGIIRSACTALLDAEDRLTDLDRVVGDGDLGVSMARGAKALEHALPTFPLENVPATLKAIGQTLRSELGGASGPLYGVLFIRASSVLEQGTVHDLRQWAKALREACSAIGELGGAKLGDRTMLDALVPFAQTLDNASTKGIQPAEALQSALQAAEQGAQQTANMIARRGRSRYLGERALNHPDPGAVAATIWLRAVVRALTDSAP
jgi:triose/dihydroxyacetone kinase / FAD-AMP lyase (cyclizing)